MVASLERIQVVDVDSETLMEHRYLLQPLLYDHLLKRARPLTLQMFCGDAAQYDSRLSGAEAVTLIEVIEHLYQDVLSGVVHNVFHNLRPRLVVMTTPNSEYNVVFRRLEGFRHWDHKFEWTRDQFQQWAEDITSRYEYSVTFDGVGEPPASYPDVGHCSQMAIFRRDSESEHQVLADSSSDDAPYRLIDECTHPHQTPLTPEQSVVLETKYTLGLIAYEARRQAPDDLQQGGVSISVEEDGREETLRVPLEYLRNFPKIRQLCPDLQSYRSALVKLGCFQLDSGHTCILHTLEVEDMSLPSDTDSLDSQEDPSHNTGPEGDWTENWDT